MANVTRCEIRQFNDKGKWLFCCLKFIVKRVMIQSKFVNWVPKTKIQQKPDSYELVCNEPVKSSTVVHET